MTVSDDAHVIFKIMLSVCAFAFLRVLTITAQVPPSGYLATADFELACFMLMVGWVAWILGVSILIAGVFIDGGFAE